MVAAVLVGATGAPGAIFHTVDFVKNARLQDWPPPGVGLPTEYTGSVTLGGVPIT